MKFDILFLGRLFPKEKEAEIKSKMKTGMQDAANALQWNIIDGLIANDCGKINILNYLPVDSYPRGYEERNIPTFEFSHTSNHSCDGVNVGCTNLSIIKQLFNVYPFRKHIKKWAQNKSDTKKVLILYTASKMFLSLAKYAKLINSQIEICCVIADIPEFATASDLHGIRKIYNIYQKNKCALLYKYVDKFVLLTEQMAERLGIKVPFTVVEGIAPTMKQTVNSEVADKYKDKRYILYTGTLNCKFGIGELLDAFSLIPNEDVNLIICGFGQAEERIIEKQKKDARIIFLGRVSRDDVLALQRGATVLVNPRQNNEEFTKYSFPSKTMEYLASGVPLVAYKLDGIPDEYDEYINYVCDGEVSTLSSELLKIISLDEKQRKQMGMAAKEFVLKQKNSVVQCEKILKLIAGK